MVASPFLISFFIPPIFFKGDILMLMDKIKREIELCHKKIKMAKEAQMEAENLLNRIRQLNFKGGSIQEREILSNPALSTVCAKLLKIC